VQLQCLQRTPGRRVTEKSHFSTLNVGLAGTGNQTQATCFAGSVSRHLAIHYASDKWLKHGVIKKSCSPWNFGLVAAPKKGGTIRWCADYRTLDDISSISSSPISKFEDNLARLSRSTIFSGFDSIGAFHVIELEDKDKAKTAFATPWGSYQFVQMPFGLAGGPSSYACLVNMVPDGIPYTQALPYLDDTVIHSKDLAGHFIALDQVLQAYKKAAHSSSNLPSVSCSNKASSIWSTW
jgi:hypothetical protein